MQVPLEEGWVRDNFELITHEMASHQFLFVVGAPQLEIDAIFENENKLQFGHVDHANAARHASRHIRCSQ